MNPVGSPGTKHLVSATDRANKNLGAAILVEERAARRRRYAHRLRHQERQRDGLAGAGWPDNREIANLPAMEIEVSTGSSSSSAASEIAGPHRFPVLLPDREIVQRGETDEITRGNQGGARDIGKIARHLRPEAGSAFMSSRTVVMPKFCNSFVAS